jgi:copper transport protein
MTMRRLLKPGVLVAGALAFLMLSATPALAHASFEGSEPGANSQVQTSPKQIVLRFSESVTVEKNAIKLYDSKQKAISTGKYGREKGDSSTVTVPVPKLAEGTYAVTWRVVSADSHPIDGAFTFAVGNVAINSKTNDLARDLLSKQGGGNDVVGSTFAVVRFLAFFGLAVFVGVCMFMVALFTEGWGSPRVKRLVWGGWAVAFAATVLGICLQGAYSTGGGLGDALKPSVISDVLDTRFGKAWLARLVLLLLAIPVVRALQRTRARRGPLVVAGALLAVAIMVTPGWGGHASTGRWVAIALPFDVIHLLATSMWFGGLLVLSLEVLRSDDLDVLEPLLDRFSGFALGSVAVIIATGSFQMLRQVEHWNLLLNTGYGRLLLVKLGAFAAVLVVASASRDIVRYEIRRRGRPALAGALPAGPGAMRAAPELPDPQDTMHRLRSAVRYEIGFAIAVYAVTALLVNAAPVRADTAKPFVQVLTTENTNLVYDVDITPTRVGPNELHLTAQKPTGEEVPLVGITVTVANPDKGIAPIPVKLIRLGTGGHYTSANMSIPFAGTWRIDIKGLVTDVDEAAAAADFKVSN